MACPPRGAVLRPTAATSSKRPRSAPAKRPAPSVKKGPALYAEPFPRPEGTLAFGGIAR